MTTNAKRFIMLQEQINEQIDTVGQADIEFIQQLTIHEIGVGKKLKFIPAIPASVEL